MLEKKGRISAAMLLQRKFFVRCQMNLAYLKLIKCDT
ncbi:hypothetical protein FPR_19440 [Faecalibacterium prausnitzii SL3/3]|uniref:Uncharacterized protein n=1 Tax=Faecalibacterium prausnitzii SL3/3 TaxID=657322 RepID=D4KBF3_9FIRM|nr:hypothetical protein FPR_19440 [Faecalibacterium prausnitzii SL3/3]